MSSTSVGSHGSAPVTMDAGGCPSFARILRLTWSKAQQDRPASRRWMHGLTVAFAAACVLAVVAGPVAAQTCYPPGSAGCTSTTSRPATSAFITVSPDPVVLGQLFTVNVGGFQPGATITFTIDGQTLGTVIADGEGRGSITTTTPAGIGIGQHTVGATGTGANGQPLVLAKVITVVAGSGVVRSNVDTGAEKSNAKAGLAKTGTSVVPLTAAGVGLLLSGVMLRRSVKKKRASVA